MARVAHEVDLLQVALVAFLTIHVAHVRKMRVGHQAFRVLGQVFVRTVTTHAGVFLAPPRRVRSR